MTFNKHKDRRLTGYYGRKPSKPGIGTNRQTNLEHVEAKIQSPKQKQRPEDREAKLQGKKAR